MSYSLINVATADDYTQPPIGAALDCLGTARLVLTVANAAVLYQLARGRGNWGEEHFLIQSIFTFERSCDGIRFRSAARGVPALVTVEAATDEDVG